MARADDVDWSPTHAPIVTKDPPLGANAATTDPGAAPNFIAAWQAVAAQARANQPAWSSPLVTTTGMLEQRFRFDLSEQHAGNGANTTVLDGGRGLDLIVSPSNEIQIAAPPYEFRSAVPHKPAFDGFGDWAFMRFKQQLAAEPASGGNYFVTVWLQVQAPAGIPQLTNDAWTYLPTLAFGKGWGDFDIQATVGGVLPSSNVAAIGDAIQTNIALQYHVFKVLWPELEVNWTYFASGQRGGLNQVFLTPGLVIGRFKISDAVQFTSGIGYQVAVSPTFRASPLTPAYNNAWLFTSRFNF